MVPASQHIDKAAAAAASDNVQVQDDWEATTVRDGSGGSSRKTKFAQPPAFPPPQHLLAQPLADKMQPPEMPPPTWPPPPELLALHVSDAAYWNQLGAIAINCLQLHQQQLQQEEQPKEQQEQQQEEQQEEQPEDLLRIHKDGYEMEDPYETPPELAATATEEEADDDAADAGAADAGRKCRKRSRLGLKCGQLQAQIEYMQAQLECLQEEGDEWFGECDAEEEERVYDHPESEEGECHLSLKDEEPLYLV